MPSITHKYKGRGMTVYIIIRISINNEKLATGVRTEVMPMDIKDNPNITTTVIIDTGM